MASGICVYSEVGTLNDDINGVNCGVKVGRSADGTDDRIRVQTADCRA